MQKIYLTTILFYFYTAGFSQIPTLPTSKSVSNSANNVFTLPKIGMQSSDASRAVGIPRNFVSSSTSAVEMQNRKMIEDDFKRVAKEESGKKVQQAELEKDVQEMKLRQWVDNGRNMSYDLTSFVGKVGTQSYYEAFNKLSAMDTENYSLADVNFTVENAFYDNKNDLKSFKSGINKTAKQLLQKMKERRQDTENNVSKNLMIFEYFSKDMNLGGTTHKAFEYDFKDYMGEKDYSKMFVSKLLKTGSGQCHSMPLYYLMLAEAMNTEAYLSMAPNHSYVRFVDNEGEIRNVELTSGMFTTDTSLLESGFIKSEALQNKIYMDNLTKKELLGMAYFDLARGYVHRFGYDEFVNKVIDKALELYPNGIAPNMEKANIQRARFLSSMKRLGINPQDPNEQQLIGYFPKAIEQINQGTQQMQHIDDLGYAEMPASAYEAWLASLKTESNKQESEALAQKIHLYELQKQKEKQEVVREKKKQEQKPKYIQIDPSKL